MGGKCYHSRVFWMYFVGRVSVVCMVRERVRAGEGLLDAVKCVFLMAAVGIIINTYSGEKKWTNCLWV